MNRKVFRIVGSRSGGCPALAISIPYPTTQVHESDIPSQGRTYTIIPRPMIMPPTDCIDQPCGIQFAHPLRKRKLRIRRHNLRPALVVDDPRHDTRVALELVDEDIELAREFVLLRGVGFHQGHGWHVLDYEEAQLVAGAVEEGGFDFYLLRVSWYVGLRKGAKGEEAWKDVRVCGPC
jgi:hypothetical protein